MSPLDPIGLPSRPSSLADQRVACWTEPVTMPTYEPADPSLLPDFLSTRVYQGGSGAVYPMPLIEAIATEPTERAWQAVHLENDWIRLMVLPELGGRIHVGFDRVRGYDFFYRNDVIKPALVGLAGPWISGGVEFNWPQHHRPATFLPTQVEIETDESGAVTVWCSDHDPLNRLKGMHGIRLSPDRAVIELLARVHNRTEITQTFLWWANVAAKVDEHYQSFFPNDVHFVADHANRATTAFPAADRAYYGIDYAARVDEAHPDADRLDWYRNIPVPTSYMVLETDDEFFGGYDHAAKAGFVHWASREVSPGKKQWTWGNDPFGWAWDEALCDDGAHYVELMAGVHTNNQPDFTFLFPGETKTFSQLWYPIGALGPAQQASPDAAGHLSLDDGFDLRLQSTRDLADVRVVLRHDGDDAALTEWTPGSLAVGQVFVAALPEQVAASDLDPGRLVAELHSGDDLVLAVRPAVGVDGFTVPPPATEPVPPSEVGTNDELYFIGSHLEQYRHATRSPETWWGEALRRDPGDVRVNTAMGARRYRSGDFAAARGHLQTAVDRTSRLNLNPRDAEGHYLLGLALARQGETDLAWKVLARAGWDGHWWEPAQLAMARLELRSGERARLKDAAERLLKVVDFAPQQTGARALAVVALRRLGRDDEAQAVLDGTLERDPLDPWARFLAGHDLHLDPVTWLDVAKDCRDAGELDAALQALDAAASAPHVPGMTGVAPLVAWHRARVLHDLGRDTSSALDAAARADARWCQPIDLDDVAVLEWATQQRSSDPLPFALLGNWCHHHRRHAEAEQHWTTSAALLGDAPGDRAALAALVARNLGLASFNTHADPDAAWQHYLDAVAFAPDDAKLFSELDQLAERRGEAVADRLARLEARRDLVAQRHELAVSHARLLVLAGRADEARDLLQTRIFQPWEGGEGQALSAWDAASIAASTAAVADGDAERAVALLESAVVPPRTLGEQRHPLANQAQFQLALGDALAAAGRSDEARAAFTVAASASGDFRDMATTEHSDLSFYQVVALRRLGEVAAADVLLTELVGFTERLATTQATIDHFATSLPQLLLFQRPANDDRDDQVAVLRAQVALLEGRVDDPVVAAAVSRLPHHVTLWLSRQTPQS